MKLARFVVLFAVTVALGGAALGGSFALLGPAAAEFRSVTSYGPLDPTDTRPAENSYMYDRYGNLMTSLFAEEDRAPITLDDVPQHLIDAVIAIEDRKFYEHQGVDVNGVMRALVENLDAGSVEQGGSTITQQLVKNTMSDPKKRDLGTKAKEAVLAIRLEDVLSKDEILERYLNVIYLGNGAYGVKSAAERYWNKAPAELTIGEAAMLAGLIQAPERLNPVVYPDRAARRRALALDAMVQTGVITEAQAAEGNLEPLPTEARNPSRRYDFFQTEVIDRLLKDDPDVDGDVAEYLGPNQAARYNNVFRGGLHIHTTYDPIAQYVAAVSVAQILPDTPVVASVVVLDNVDLAVRAMYPGFNFDDLQYNPITAAGRQTGSTFKVITMLAALDAGYSPDDRVSADGVTIERPGEDWTPRNCGGGTVTLTNAIVASRNCAFARILASLGPGNHAEDGSRRVVEMAGRLGIDASKLVAVPPLTLGASNTNVLDMAEAFAVMPNDGLHRTPMFVTRVEDSDGETIYEAESGGERVLSAEVARSATAMLQGVIQSGTGTRANIGRPAAGKTGTTNANTDAWFVGFTPQMTAAVWMGNIEAQRSMSEFGINNAQGGTYPARIWAAVMRPLHEDLPVVDFVPPDRRRWPTPQRITETGRIFTRDFVEEPTTTAPADTTPPPPITVPPTVPTSPPPPTTLPPTVAPTTSSPNPSTTSP